MPAILTHDFFGKDVVDDVAENLGFTHTDERDAFLLGNQGPDPLFYLVVSPSLHMWEPLGNAMHSSRPAPLFFRMREEADRMEGHQYKVARAYMAGFVCHWLLDSTMHPFVYFWQNGICAAGVEGLDESHGSRVHAEIERDFDEMVLYAKTGLTARTYRAHSRTLHGSTALITTIDKLYFHEALWVFGKPISPLTYSVAVRYFRRVQNLFDSPLGIKREALGHVERDLLRQDYSLVCSMSHRDRKSDVSDFDNRDNRPWQNPFTGEVRTDSFWDLYEDARARVPEAIERVLAPDIDQDAAIALTGNVNFEGDISAPDAPLAW